MSSILSVTSFLLSCSSTGFHLPVAAQKRYEHLLPPDAGVGVWCLEHEALTRLTWMVQPRITKFYRNSSCAWTSMYQPERVISAVCEGNSDSWRHQQCGVSSQLVSSCRVLSHEVGEYDPERNDETELFSSSDTLCCATLCISSWLQFLWRGLLSVGCSCSCRLSLDTNKEEGFLWHERKQNKASLEQLRTFRRYKRQTLCLKRLFIWKDAYCFHLHFFFYCYQLLLPCGKNESVY